MNDFHYPTENGEIVVPQLAKIKGGLLRRHRKLDEMDMVFSILEELVDADTLAKIDDLEQGQLVDFITKWQSGASVGESSGSST